MLREGTAVTEEQGRDHDVGALRKTIIAAALRYRDATRAYLAVQAVAVRQGSTLDDLVAGNQERLREAAQAEETLFGLLDTLDAPADRCAA
jgi:hypothetical protein